MAITPQTNLRLLKCPLELDYKNQLTFNNVQAQTTYFLSLPYIEVEEISYQRKDNIIRFPGHIDSLLEYNYCMYQNSNYSDKWFYAFIINMEYYNDGTTFIAIATDVFQTWQFDLTWKKSFVDREMINVADDIAGNNLIVEDLETGEYINSSINTVLGLNPVYVLAYSRDPFTDGYDPTARTRYGSKINNMPACLFYCVCSAETIGNLVETISSDGHGESIVAIFTCPALAFIGLNGLDMNILNNQNSVFTEWIPADFTGSNYSITPTSKYINQLGSYTPRNQKLFTYPYCYIAFNPPIGNSEILKYENFSSNNITFTCCCEINPNPTIVLSPRNYKSMGYNTYQSLTLGGYPSISYYTDYFNSWIAQNQNLINLDVSQRNYNDTVSVFKKTMDLVSDITTTTWSAMSGQPGGSGLTGVASDGLDLVSIGQNNEYYIKKQMAQIEAQKLVPNKVSLGTTNTTLLNFNLFQSTILSKFFIKPEFAERIDSYFDMYGYKTNALKIPNLNNRPNWNYIKTVGANILGNIPQKHIEMIKKMFDSGVTLWHNPATFLDYSQNNR